MFSDVLKKLRDREGWTQLELAKKLGMAKSSISMLESGARKPSYETLEAIADIFNVDMNTLTDDKGSRASSDSQREVERILDMYRNRPECRMLFSVMDDATPDDIRKAAAIIEALRKAEGD